MKYALWSDQEVGYWSNLQGWVEDFQSATLFDEKHPFSFVGISDAHYIEVPNA